MLYCTKTEDLKRGVNYKLDKDLICLCFMDFHINQHIISYPKRKIKIIIKYMFFLEVKSSPFGDSCGVILSLQPSF